LEQFHHAQPIPVVIAFPGIEKISAKTDSFLYLRPVYPYWFASAAPRRRETTGITSTRLSNLWTSLKPQSQRISSQGTSKPAEEKQTTASAWFSVSAL